MSIETSTGQAGPPPILDAPTDQPTGQSTDRSAVDGDPGDGATPGGRRPDARRLGFGLLRWVVAIGAAVVIYSAFLVLNGASPIEVIEAMWESAFGDTRRFGDTLLRTTPLLLAALAVVVPARAGLFNIGGEGQLVLGAIGAMGMALALDGAAPTPVAIVLMALAGATAGAVWSAIPGLLKVLTRTNEAITSLLLNYVAVILLTWLVFEPWRDPRSTGQAFSSAIPSDERLPIMWANRVNIGILLAVTAAVVVWLLFRSTRWGFKLQVVGGNPEAARRAGFLVGGLSVGAMIVGGALAGLGGMIEVAGVESRLRPGIMVGFGYMGFLASWLARHDPLKVVVAAFVLAAIAVGGNGLKVAAGLSDAAVNVLMALVLLAVLGWAQRSPRREAA